MSNDHSERVKFQIKFEYAIKEDCFDEYWPQGYYYYYYYLILLTRHATVALQQKLISKGPFQNKKNN